MKGVSYRLFAIFAIAMMIAVPFSVSLDYEGTDAADVDYTRYYYDQLDSKLSKTAYDKILAMNGSTATVTFDVDMNEFTDKTQNAVTEKIKNAIQLTVNALSLERPETYWIDLNSETKMSYSKTGDTVVSATVTIPFNDFIDYPPKAVADAEIESAMKDITVDTTNTYTKVKSIHDALANILVYNSAGSSESIRSIYTALAGDHNVVCEGYAKSFKIMCDMYDVPCIIVTGDAQGSGGLESHMYNYVLMPDGEWYLVDVTWDDQTTLRDTYLLAGADTMGFTLTVGESHFTNNTVGYGFEVPALADDKYGMVKQNVNFVTNGGSSVSSISLIQNECAREPTEPIRNGYIFAGWYSDSELSTPYVWSAAVTEDITLYAKWVENDKQFTISLDISDEDGSDKELYGNYNEVVKLSFVPTKEEFVFAGWNTESDGSGTTYKTGDSITVTDDLKLYAQWTEAPSDESSENFLDGEIVPGVKNLYLIAGVAIALVAIIAIAYFVRK